MIAGGLLVTAVTLAWCSVTPSGALSCLHCFLAQRWVEGAIFERRVTESQPGFQVVRVQGAAPGSVADASERAGSAIDGPPQAGAIPSLVPDRPVVHSLRPILCRHDDRGRVASCGSPAQLGLRAPPRTISL